MYGTQRVVNAECCNETVVHNALGEMWSVCIMASIWRNNPEVIISSPRKGKVMYSIYFTVIHSQTGGWNS